MSLRFKIESKVPTGSPVGTFFGSFGLNGFGLLADIEILGEWFTVTACKGLFFALALINPGTRIKVDTGTGSGYCFECDTLGANSRRNSDAIVRGFAKALERTAFVGIIQQNYPVIVTRSAGVVYKRSSKSDVLLVFGRI